MIEYRLHKLANGLTLLASRDRYSKMAACNLLYKVGARNESPEHTGFAHLFEHLMFRGTRLIPDFDTPVQNACGENNAFTNNDYTDYYITLPKDNIETALWLESDRMTGLNITPDALATEKMVVIEEFNQRYINQPYGDQWLLLRDMAYKVHPYRWPTIGLTPDHIAQATLEEVRAFYERYYVPSNAILAVVGDYDEQEVFDLSEKWFGDIPSVDAPKDTFPAEPAQTEARRMVVERDVPVPQITLAFQMCDRFDDDYYLCDMISDLFAGGTSSILMQNLVKSKKVFSVINAYITGDIDKGLFVITGQPSRGVTVEQAEQALWDELESQKSRLPDEYEMEKVKNKFEANTLFGELNVMNKALNLCYYAMLGDMERLNGEISRYRALSSESVLGMERRLFTHTNCSTLIINPLESKN